MAGPPRQLLLKDFLKSKHYRIPHGLKIDSVGQGLLKLLYDTKTGMMEELDFAKRMRTPWVIKIGEFGMIYSNIQHMMEQCKTIMADDPSEKDLCEELIHNCKEMLRIVGKSPSRLFLKC